MRALSKISDFKKRVVPTEYAAELLQAFVEKDLVRETQQQNYANDSTTSHLIKNR